MKITNQDLAEEIFVAIRDLFEAVVSWQGNVLTMAFLNGETFHIPVLKA